MAALLIVDVTEIRDPEKYEIYKSMTPDAIAAFGGRFLVRGNPCEQLEGDYLPSRHVIVEFESMDRLKEFYHSDTYAPALAIRLAIATSNAYAVETL